MESKIKVIKLTKKTQKVFYLKGETKYTNTKQIKLYTRRKKDL